MRFIRCNHYYRAIGTLSLRPAITIDQANGKVVLDRASSNLEIFSRRCSRIGSFLFSLLAFLYEIFHRAGNLGVLSSTWFCSKGEAASRAKRVGIVSNVYLLFEREFAATER